LELNFQARAIPNGIDPLNPAGGIWSNPSNSRREIDTAARNQLESSANQICRISMSRPLMKAAAAAAAAALNHFQTTGGNV